MRKTKISKRKMGIKGKLITILIPVVALSITGLLTITFMTARNIILNYGSNIVRYQAEANGREVEIWSSSIISSLAEIKNTLEFMNLDDAETIHYLATTMDRNPSLPLGVYIGTDSGQLLDPSGFVPGSDYVVTERDWYKEGLQKDNFAFGVPYADADTGEYCITASARLHIAGGATRIAAADVYLSEVTRKVAEMQVLKTGASMLIDKTDGVIMGYKDKNLISKQLDEKSDNGLIAAIAREVKKGNGKVFTLKDKGVSYLGYLQSIEGTEWVLASYVSEREVLSSINSLIVMVIFGSLAAIVLLGIIIERVLHFAVIPIKRVTGSIEEITQGNFNIEVEVKGTSEVTVMAESLQKYINIMRGIIQEFHKLTHNLTLQAGSSDKAAGTLMDSAKLQASSMQELNITVDELSKTISEVAESASSLAQVVSSADSISRETGAKMKRTVTLSEEGRQRIDKVNLVIKDVEKDIYGLEEAVENVGNSSREINKIVSLIGEIADQTNLLSLNAAIEASRAGDAGKGFAVVAEEIRKLAETSSGAVGKIAENIKQINILAENTAVKTRASVESIELSSALIQETSVAFEDIYNAVNEADVLVNALSDRVREVDQVAVSVAAITEEQSAGTEQILATSAELLSAANEVTRISELMKADASNLTITSDNLDDKLKFFQLSEQNGYGFEKQF
ncbi:methyl-accepting chemotaxis protein [Anaerocolumna xylanovorans]|uniref:Methyl-accepting chemotaxis protein n=1 Tax=Anaerocolumna xylanovorans DSM 12503 TaxID=1121345 RepID=A0A1M7XZB8_9FIRM|nr:methyl-accepting chemotaxis protein [Anaerocolumna xylanovorans]SHO44514.1 methyl-accepting chemotaxis protein [Anaerocolumna xylanovorans DSM 12503]